MQPQHERRHRKHSRKGHRGRWFSRRTEPPEHAGEYRGEAPPLESERGDGGRWEGRYGQRDLGQRPPRGEFGYDEPSGRGFQYPPEPELEPMEGRHRYPGPGYEGSDRDFEPGSHRGPGYTGGGGPASGPDLRYYAGPDWGTHRWGPHPRLHERGYSNIFEHERRGRGESGRGSSLRGVGPKGYTRSDDRICEHVCEQLEDADDLDPSEVSVVVEHGEVTLSGSVDSRWAKRYCEDLAYGVRGVENVHNQLKISSREQPAESRSLGEQGNGQRRTRSPSSDAASQTQIREQSRS